MTTEMTTEQMWSAIQDVDPAADIRYVPPGGWSVRLTSLYYQALDGRSLVTALKVPSRQQAIERIWARLMSLREAATVYRDFGEQHRRIGWEGDQWARIPD